MNLETLRHRTDTETKRIKNKINTRMKKRVNRKGKERKKVAH